MAAPEAGLNVPALVLAQVVQGTAPCTGLDFHEDGERFVVTSTDHTITVVDALEGRARKTINCKKYGTGLVRYTHHDQSILVTSDNPNGDHSIRYLSLYDNKYLRFFRGHTDRVTSLSMCPTGDNFLTASADKTVRLWTLNKPECQAVLTFSKDGGDPHVTYDLPGVVFAVSASTAMLNIIKLYDVASYERGPFDTFEIKHEDVANFIQTKNPAWPPSRVQALARARWTHMEFSSDGNSILVTTDGPVHLILDAWDGKVKQALTGHKNDSRLRLNACYTADGQYVLSGSEDQCLYAWDAQDGTVAAVLTGHVTPVRQVACSPKYGVVASAGVYVGLWIPKQANE